jgi:2-dehydro-3-deoxyphosphogluconate aldolase/(4S)-4-hydroxy-2-oxoglutarate aldolase
VIYGLAMSIDQLLRLGPVIPVIVIEDARQSVPLARALAEGGVCVLEITLRTEAALEAIRRTAHEVPDTIVGVGTITQPQQFSAAREAGARFAVRPASHKTWLGRPKRVVCRCCRA